MSPTCVKKPMLTNPIALALCAAVVVGSVFVSAPAHAASKAKASRTEIAAPIPGTVTVSDYEFNTFVFPDAVKKIYFPSGSPVTGAPIYLQENSQVLLQFSKGSSGKPVQMVAELENGTVVSIRVVPKAVPGVTHAINGARVRSAASNKRVVANAEPTSATPQGADIELLKVLATTGEAPDGFEPVALPAPTRFDKFTVVPLAGWTDGSERRVMVFSLVAVPGQTAVVSPPQFYRPGISAVIVDGDVVDAVNSPQLFVVEELNDE